MFNFDFQKGHLHMSLKPLQHQVLGRGTCPVAGPCKPLFHPVFVAIHTERARGIKRGKYNFELADGSLPKFLEMANRCWGAVLFKLKTSRKRIREYVCMFTIRYGESEEDSYSNHIPNQDSCILTWRMIIYNVGAPQTIELVYNSNCVKSLWFMTGYDT